MSNETVANYAAKRANNAMERLQQLEEKIALLESALKTTADKADASIVLCDAMGDMLGSDKVAEKVRENQTRRARAVAEEQAASVKTALETNRIVTADFVSESSLVVIVEKDKEGNVVEPGRLQFWFVNLNEDFKAKMLGKRVGDVIEGNLERTATVAEIYELAAPAEAAAQPAAQ